MKSTSIQGVAFATWFLITPFMLPMLQLNQTTFSLFTHSFIYLAIYWTTGKALRIQKLKATFLISSNLTSCAPSYLWAVNLSVSITWMFSLPQSTPAQILPMPQCLLSPDSNITFFLKLPSALFLSPSWKKSIPPLKGYSTSPAFSEGYGSFSNKNYMFQREWSVSVSLLYLKEHSIPFCANINYSVKFSWVDQYLRDASCKWGLSKS